MDGGAAVSNRGVQLPEGEVDESTKDKALEETRAALIKAFKAVQGAKYQHVHEVDAGAVMPTLGCIAIV